MTDREPPALDVLDDAGRKVLFTEARTANTFAGWLLPTTNWP
ncbi:hypothetical protein ACFWAN_27810 [Streptomyces mirabilis]